MLPPLHMEYNLWKFGSNNNSHSGPCESNPRENVEKSLRNKQQQKDTIDDQLCKQLSEKMVLDLPTRLVNEAQARHFAPLERQWFTIKCNSLCHQCGEQASNAHNLRKWPKLENFCAVILPSCDRNQCGHSIVIIQLHCKLCIAALQTLSPCHWQLSGVPCWLSLLQL